MTIADANITSTQLKTLKMLLKCNGSIPYKEYMQSHNDHDYMLNIDPLIQRGLIVTFPGSESDLELTYEGEQLIYLIKEGTRSKLFELLFSKWLDVIVAFITAAITSANWDAIESWLISLISA